MSEGNAPTENNSEKELGNIFAGIKKFLQGLLEIRSDTDKEAVVKDVKDDIAFKGHTVWILICSIFIASIGLNANSTAVVIGAMLISPLIGPILGMGLSLSINDVELLKRSLKNFGVMVFISVFTAFLFFKLFPLNNQSSELLARTAPDIRDVLIAFVGGIALIVARAKKGTVASVIFGVSIATALMPPLCTVGYGLAIWNFKFVLGALYLFLINTVFIALATFVITKFIKVPVVRYTNSKKQKRIARFASIVALLAMIPAGITFFMVWKKTVFNTQAQQFITENVASYQFSKNGKFLESLSRIDYVDSEKNSIELVFMGDETIPDNIINTWRIKLIKDYDLEHCKLNIVQGEKNKDNSAEKYSYVAELYESKKEEIKAKNEQIAELKKQLSLLEKKQSKTETIPFEQIAKEVKINYGKITSLAFSYELRTDFKTIDTIPVFYVRINEKSFKNRDTIVSQLFKWMKVKISNPKLEIRDRKFE